MTDDQPSLARSADGTSIAYEVRGSGPTLVIVNGAFSTRSDARSIADALAPRFTVVVYDRRGRGDSGDSDVADSTGEGASSPADREVEDLRAVLAATAGEGFVFGHSSGAVLALRGALAGLPISRLVLYEPPFIVDDSRPPAPADYAPTMKRLLGEGRRGDAVAYFWRVGLQMPDHAIEAARTAPYWPHLESLAHTLPYDNDVMGDTLFGKPLPTEWREKVTVPTLVLDGADSAPPMRNAAAALVDLLPNATGRTLPGVAHSVPAEVLAPILEEFLLGG